MDPGRLSGRAILVAEDVRFTRISLMRMLERMGYTEVYEAEDGAAALRLLEGKSVDCVISDLEMPNLSGLGLLKAIRGGSGTIPRDVPVIFHTGYSELELLGPALLLDPDAFLAKPVSQQALQRCLEDLFDPQKRPKRVLADANFYAQVELASAVAERTGDADAPGEELAGRAVPLASVPVNAVLARDLLYANGRLLLRAGAKLTPQILDRLRDMAALTALPETAWIIE